MEIKAIVKRELDIIKKQLIENYNYQRSLENVPNYKVRVSNGHGYDEYFYVDENKKLKYITTANREYARKLIQKDYNARVEKKLLEQKKIIENFLSKYEENAADNVYMKCCKGRKELINPIVLPEQEYIDAWSESHPGNLNPFSEEGRYSTNRGEMVRSKLE